MQKRFAKNQSQNKRLPTSFGELTKMDIQLGPCLWRLAAIASAASLFFLCITLCDVRLANAADVNQTTPPPPAPTPEDVLNVFKGAVDQMMRLKQQPTNPTSAVPEVTPQAQSANEQTTYKTSFDCTKASTPAEHLICTNQELAASDVQISDTYAKLRAATNDNQAAAIRKDQSRWLETRDRNCSTGHDHTVTTSTEADQIACLKNELTSRLADLNNQYQNMAALGKLPSPSLDVQWRVAGYRMSHISALSEDEAKTRLGKTQEFYRGTASGEFVTCAGGLQRDYKKISKRDLLKTEFDNDPAIIDWVKGDYFAIHNLSCPSSMTKFSYVT